MWTAMSSTANADMARRADSERLRALVLRQALATMLKPVSSGAKSLAQDSWQSMLADAMADATARAIDTDGRVGVRGSSARPVGVGGHGR